MTDTKELILDLEANRHAGDDLMARVIAELREHNDLVDELCDLDRYRSMIYEDVVDFNLGLQPSGFSFAREVRQLSKLSGATPLTGYTNVFDIPGPYTGLPIFLSDDITDPDRRFTAFILTGGKVHSDADPLFAMVKFRPDPYRWTATFRSATIAAIASRLAFAVASDRATSETLRAEAYGTPSENFRGGMMRAALSEDGFSNPPRKPAVDNNPLTRAWRS